MASGPIPVIDLFAGPGGLGEGFASVEGTKGRPAFDIRLSIEKDPVAHKTLLLRALYRTLSHGQGVPDSYYDYIRADISRQEFFGTPSISSEIRHAEEEARCATLGESSPEIIDEWIKNSIGKSDPWVLIGGPPCQAYSLAGRSRMKSVDPKAFEEDKRHFLYKEYLRIIRKFKPAVFVMENVKGLLSSTHGGEPMFDRIHNDLCNPCQGLEYEIRSLVKTPGDNGHSPADFVIEAENFGVPQMRHRVILLGVRSDYANRPHELLKPEVSLTHAGSALSGLPRIRSRISRGSDSFENWYKIISATPSELTGWRSQYRHEVESQIQNAIVKASRTESFGGKFIGGAMGMSARLPRKLATWLYDPKLVGICQHESRGHMPSDLNRYLFAASYAKVVGTAPKLGDFPPKLLPNHKNISQDDTPFMDRFRVQLRNQPSTTVVSHISKDGHYYIHPDPSQCRSLTVREAARLQTFPDNYFFEGGRTEQYVQVGNAVPPYLALQIAQVVSKFLRKNSDRHGNPPWN